MRYSRVRRAWEGWRKLVTATAPYRCGKCGWRGWGPSPDVHLARNAAVDERPEGPLAAVVLAAAPPSLDELDLDVLNIPRRHAHG